VPLAAALIIIAFWICMGQASHKTPDPVMQVVGAPLAAALLAMDGFLGLDGWQWLFLAEGLPTIAFGLWLRVSLADAPATAKFLAPPERAWLARRNEAHKVRLCRFALAGNEATPEGICPSLD